MAHGQGTCIEGGLLEDGFTVLTEDYLGWANDFVALPLSADWTSCVPVERLISLGGWRQDVFLPLNKFPDEFWVHGLEHA